MRPVFVGNLEYDTRRSDLERLFSKYGKVEQIDLKIVNWSKANSEKRRDRSPTKTLFVSNLDPIRTKEHDVERKFETYGKVVSIRMRRDYAFVQFATQEDATKALERTRNTKILDQIVLVKYALRDGKREDNPRRRSPSPAPCKSRPSPSYDRYRSPSPPFQRERA